MKLHWFVKFLIIAVCIKFLIHGFLISLLLGIILGFRTHEKSQTIYAVILGGVLGLVSAILISIFSASTGFSFLLTLTRTIGLSTTNSLVYATVGFISFAYIVVIEMIFVTLFVRIGESISQFMEKQKYRFNW